MSVVHVRSMNECGTCMEHKCGTCMKHECGMCMEHVTWCMEHE